MKDVGCLYLLVEPVLRFDQDGCPTIRELVCLSTALEMHAADSDNTVACEN